MRAVLGLKRRVLPNGDLEPPWTYRQRTARLIFKLAADAGVKLCYHQVVLRVFRVAWRERVNVSPSGNPVQQVRCARSRLW